MAPRAEVGWGMIQRFLRTFIATVILSVGALAAGASVASASTVGVSSSVVAASTVGVSSTVASAGTIGVIKSLVGTYNVSANVPSQYFGGGVFTGQIALASDGTWTGTGLLNALGCTMKGNWPASPTVLALSTLPTSGGCDDGGGMTSMIKVDADGSLGTSSAPGYINSPDVFNATWDATRAPATPPTPGALSKFRPNAKLATTYKLSYSGQPGKYGLTLNF